MNESRETKTIIFDGVEIPDFGEKYFPYGAIEITRRCNLRCKTCFFFQAFQHEEEEMEEEKLIRCLRALQRRHNIKFISWVGGEPLLRRRIIEQAPSIFPMGIMFTNGILPIPDIPIFIGVSLDGPPELNDPIRGKGVYDKVVKTLEEAPRKVFIQCVVTKVNAPVLERFTETLTKLPNVSGVIYSIYVPQKGEKSELAFSLPERDELIELLLRLKDVHTDFILNERRGIELARSSTCKQITDNCDMKDRCLALDYRLNRRRPCCYGENVDCDLCAAPTPFNMAAKVELRQQGTTISFLSL